VSKVMVEYRPQAERYLKKLREKPLRRLYLETIQHIAEDPYSGEPKTGDLSGIYGYDIKYKGTSYELAYRVYEESDGNIAVVIIYSGTRENFYDDLKRYLRTSRFKN
jgi:mRNA interferase RelE/StbE